MLIEKGVSVNENLTKTIEELQKRSGEHGFGLEYRRGYIWLALIFDLSFRKLSK